MNASTWYRNMLRMSTIAILSLANFYNTQGQDTTRITPQEAEKRFIQNNLSLLAARYNIDGNRALIRQAKLWDNPVLSTDQNIYDGKFFNHSEGSGQVYVQVMQLIKTAGKRNKLARIAEDNTSISIEQFDDLVRTLRYSLLSDLFEIDHQLRIAKLYEEDISSLEKLTKAMDIQLKSGNVSLKDNLRVKALLFGLRNELVNVTAQLFPLESEVKLLLNDNDSTFYVPVLNYNCAHLSNLDIPGKEQLVQIAIANRPDAKMARLQADMQQHTLTYQKALAKPDISIGTEFDQHSSYAPNYVGLAISLPLTILNKNQGNIASAQFNVEQQQALLDAETLKVQMDISSSVSKVKFYQKVNNETEADFVKKYDALFENMLKSYQQRQINLLEFIDFTDAYKETKLKLLDHESALIKAALELNYVIAKDIITLN